MPQIIRTKGICLASHRIRETSKLVTFYSENFGKLTLLCKGARTPKSKFGSALEIFVLSELIFYKAELKPVYILSDANLIDGFPRLKEPSKFLSANQIVEVILRAVSDEDTNKKLFHLLYAALKNLDSSPPKLSKNSSFLGAYFLKAVSLLGFKPELRYCVICKNPRFTYFSIEKGGVICKSEAHPKPSFGYGMEHIKAIKYLLTNPLSKSMQLSISPGTLQLIQNYLTYHLDKVKIHSFHFDQKISKF